MRYDPKIADADLIPEGEYEIECVDGKDTTSKASGNPMLVLVWKIFHGTNMTTINTYHCSNVSGMMSRLRKAANACGVDYDGGLLGPKDFIGKTCKATIKTEEDKNGKYDPKNVIAYFMMDDDGIVAASTPTPPVDDSPPKTDDDIPF